jgi:phosphoglycolate phosphatase-like HAD superfamily hydrolase
VFGVACAFASIPMAGRTDPLIITDACEAHTIAASATQLMRLHERYYEYLAEELPREVPGKRVLPGVIPLLEAFRADPSVTLALVTGNLPRSARLKLDHFGLWHFFVTGAFGDDANERDGLLPIAVDRVSATGGPSVPPEQIVLIGDTPQDVSCARAAGARSLAVATGLSTVADLYRAGADAAVADLSSTDEVIGLIAALTATESIDGARAQRRSD